MEKTVIFDMDGVLFDTERLVLRSWSYVGGKYGIQDLENVILRCIGTNSEETRKIVMEHYGQDFPYDKLREEKSRIFDEKLDKEGIPVKPGARELLSFLKVNGFRIGLASSTKKKNIIFKLERTGLRDFFETVIGGDMVSKSKPEPDIYRKACEEMKVDPAVTYAVEDSPNGIRAAFSAGLKVFVIPDLIPPDEEIQKLAYQIYPDLIELRKEYFAKEM